MNKKTQRVYATILTVLVSIAMIGSGFLGYFLNTGTPPTTTTNNPNQAAVDYQAQKAQIEAMVKQVKLDPSNVPLQTALGNAYYDAGVAAEQVAPTEGQENFKQAVEAFQIVLKTNKDPNVMVDMATAAFYSGQNDLAEKTYQEALVLKPNFYNALGNYGVFLSQAKKDWAGALTQWQKALPLAQNSTEQTRIKTLISQAQSQLKANPATNGGSNPNPAVQNGITKPVTP